jgi:hypothetical protein
MDHEHHHRCTSTRDGQDLMGVLATEATTHEMIVTDTSVIAGQEGLRVGKSNNLECQTGPSNFPEDSSSSWSLARARGAEGWVLC